MCGGVCLVKCGVYIISNVRQGVLFTTCIWKRLCRIRILQSWPPHRLASTGLIVLLITPQTARSTVLHQYPSNVSSNPIRSSHSHCFRLSIAQTGRFSWSSKQPRAFRVVPAYTLSCGCPGFLSHRYRLGNVNYHDIIVKRTSLIATLNPIQSSWCLQLQTGTFRWNRTSAQCTLIMSLSTFPSHRLNPKSF